MPVENSPKREDHVVIGNMLLAVDLRGMGVAVIFKKRVDVLEMYIVTQPKVSQFHFG